MLPALVILLLAVFGVVLAIALLTSFLPSIGLTFWIVILGAFALLTINKPFLKTKWLDLSLGATAGLMALALVFVNLFGIQLDSFQASFVGPQSLTSSIVQVGAENSGVQPAAVFSIGAVLLGLFVTVIVASEVLKKHKIVKVKR